MSMSNEAFSQVVYVLDNDQEFQSSTPDERAKTIRTAVNFAPLGYSQKDKLLEALLTHYEVV